MQTWIHKFCKIKDKEKKWHAFINRILRNNDQHYVSFVIHCTLFSFLLHQQNLRYLISLSSWSLAKSSKREHSDSESRCEITMPPIHTKLFIECVQKFHDEFVSSVSSAGNKRKPISINSKCQKRKTAIRQME